MKKQQTGFTLIELVVVIVILGILAATALPRFTAITAQANQAVAEGILGAILSSAVIQFGVRGDGTGATWLSVITNIDLDTDSSYDVQLNASGVEALPRTSTSASCSTTAADTVSVRLTGTSAGDVSEASGVIPDGICEN